MEQNSEILDCLKALTAKFDALTEDVERLKERGQSETASEDRSRWPRLETPPTHQRQ